MSRITKSGLIRRLAESYAAEQKTLERAALLAAVAGDIDTIRCERDEALSRCLEIPKLKRQIGALKAAITRGKKRKGAA